MTLKVFKLVKTDILMIGTALGVLLLSLYCLFFDSSIFGLYPSTAQKKSTQPVLGHISLIENDTRYQQEGTWMWNSAKTEQQIHLGDGVFTGAKSKSQVTLNNGGSVSLGENTMIVFKKIQGVELANLATGNFRLKVTGDMKLAIAGKITEIKGSNSELQVFLDKKHAKPRIKLIQGTAKIKQEDAPAAVELKTNEVVLLKEPIDQQALKELAAEPPPPAPKLIARNEIETYVYTDQLYDFYMKKDDNLVRRVKRPNYVNLSKVIKWEAQGDVKMTFGQLSETADFKKALRFETTNAQFTFNHAFLGENFWRLSLDKQQWNESQKFTVVAKPLDVAPPIIIAENEFPLLDEPIAIKGKIDSALSRFVIEVSRNPQFPVDNTNVLWSAKKAFSLKVHQEGIMYLRARAVNEKMELTAYSEPSQFRVYTPKMPLTPILSQQDIRVSPNEVVHMDWSLAKNATAYAVTVKDKNNKILESRIVKKNAFSWKSKTTGDYKMVVSSVDQWGRKSSNPATAHISVEPKLRVVVASKPPPALRKPSAVESTVKASSRSEPSERFNGFINKANVNFEMSTFNLTSVDQRSLSQPSASGLAMGINYSTWWGKNGLSALFKSKVSDTSSSPSGNPMQLGALYHRRWLTSKKDFLIPMQISAVAGFEIYQNSGSLLFSPGYNLLKTGGIVLFPLASRWGVGGEILFGYGFDQSKQYELVGHLQYYFAKRWFFGLGYRMLMFEAGSTATAPAALPYREVVEEGFSLFGYHF